MVKLPLAFLLDGSDIFDEQDASIFASRAGGIVGVVGIVCIRSWELEVTTLQLWEMAAENISRRPSMSRMQG
jgi:hypothetical protein